MDEETRLELKGKTGNSTLIEGQKRTNTVDIYSNSSSSFEIVRNVWNDCKITSRTPVHTHGNL